jgi:hypothetical protein
MCHNPGSEDLAAHDQLYSDYFNTKGFSIMLLSLKLTYKCTAIFNTELLMIN